MNLKIYKRIIPDLKSLIFRASHQDCRNLQSLNLSRQQVHFIPSTEKSSQQFKDLST